MKIQKFNESVNLSTNTIKKLAVDYHNLLNDLKPLVIERYLEIVRDHTLGYGQDIVDKYGGTYYEVDNIDGIRLKDLSMHDNKFFFTLEYFDYDSDTPDITYVPFSEEELKDAIVKSNAKKYNL